MEYFSKDDVLNLLNRNSITKKITLADGVSIYDSVKNLPTADVVPKSEVEKWFRECEELQGRMIELESEVAREIFEEIDNIRMIERTFHKRGLEGCYNFDSEYEKLKKKYTESGGKE